MPELFYDILVSIFEHARYTIDYDLDTDSLLHFCLDVCKAWALPAQRILFRNVQIMYRQTLRSFYASTKSGKGKGLWLRNSVHVLHVFLGNGVRRIHPSELPLILARCPCLRDFRLTLGSEVTRLAASPKAFEKLRDAMPSRTIRALQVGVSAYDEERKILEQIFQLLPPDTLEFIAIGTQEWKATSRIMPFDPSLFEVFDHIPSVGDVAPVLDLPFNLSQTDFSPETIRTWTVSENTLVSLATFLGPGLLSISVSDEIWFPNLAKVVKAAPSLQHIRGIRSFLDGEWPNAKQVQLDIDLDRNSWTSYLTGGDLARDHNQEQDQVEQKREHRLRARTVVAYGKGSIDYISRFKVDDIVELIEETKWREDVVRMYWEDDYRTHFWRITIAKKRPPK